MTIKIRRKLYTVPSRIVEQYPFFQRLADQRTSERAIVRVRDAALGGRILRILRPLTQEISGQIPEAGSPGAQKKLIVRIAGKPYRVPDTVIAKCVMLRNFLEDMQADVDLEVTDLDAQARWLRLLDAHQTGSSLEELIEVATAYDFFDHTDLPKVVRRLADAYVHKDPTELVRQLEQPPYSLWKRSLKDFIAVHFMQKAGAIVFRNGVPKLCRVGVALPASLNLVPIDGSNGTLLYDYVSGATKTDVYTIGVPEVGPLSAFSSWLNVGSNPDSVAPEKKGTIPNSLHGSDVVYDRVHNRLLVVNKREGSLKIYFLGDCSLMHDINIGSRYGKAIAHPFLPNRILLISEGGYLYLCDINSNDTLAMLKSSYIPIPTDRQRDFMRHVQVATSPNGKHVYCVLREATIQAYSLPDLNWCGTLSPQNCAQIRMLPKLGIFYSLSRASELQLYELSNIQILMYNWPEPIKTFSLPIQCNDFLVSDDGMRVLCRQSDDPSNAACVELAPYNFLDSLNWAQVVALGDSPYGICYSKVWPEYAEFLKRYCFGGQYGSELQKLLGLSWWERAKLKYARWMASFPRAS